MNRVLIPHTPEQASMAIDWAVQKGIQITLQTPPEEVSTYGMGYLLAWMESTKDRSHHQWILDCGSEAALAVEALRLGVLHLRVDVSEAMFAKLSDIATSMGAKVENGSVAATDMRFLADLSDLV